MTLADPKPARRVKDKAVYAEFHAAGHDCLSCGSSHVEAHHLLGGPNREDVLAALAPLCHGCHQCYHGTPYRGAFGHRFTPESVRERVGRWILSEDGYDAAMYLTLRLGPDASVEFVRKLGVDVA